MTKGKTKISPELKALIEKAKAEEKALDKINNAKKICESNIVAILYKNQELFYTYDNLNLDDFDFNEWRVYFEIVKGIMLEQKTLDEVTVNLYLEKHLKLKEKYDLYGGYETIELVKEYVKEENMDGYINELYKLKTLNEISKKGFPISDKLSDFMDMSSEEIYDYYEATINHLFINTGSTEGVRISDISDGLDELIDELDKGDAVGLPFDDMPILTMETNGLCLGEFYLLLAPSGAGKSSFIRSNVLTSILKNDEKIVLMVNEEDKKKQQKELIAWVANNCFKEDLQKYKINKGQYSQEFKKLLFKCVNWIKEHNDQIIIAELDHYSTSKVIKIVKKFSSMGVKYFCLDTFKESSNQKKNEAAWEEMKRSSVEIYDLIKPKCKNVCFICTMQLKKSTTKQRFLTLDGIGGSTGVADVSGCCLMLRWMLPDETRGGNREVKVFQRKGTNNRSKVPVELNSEKRYQILFIQKNRNGSACEFQIVYEVDLSRNVYTEIGICNIEPDF